MSEQSVVLYERSGRIGHIVLNRPHVINAFNRAMYEQFNTAVERFRDDNEAWVAIVSGNGERGFSAGVDIKSLEVDQETGLTRLPPPIVLCAEMVTPKPIVAAVHGHCIGEGANIVFACDLVFAEESCQISVPEARVGVNAVDIPLKLAKKMPYNQAFDLIMGVEAKSADWCAQAGLIKEVVADHTAVQAATLWATRLIETTAPLAIRGLKETLWRAVHENQTAGQQAGQSWRDQILHSRDWTEGQQAFIEKRKPVYQGV